MHDIETGSSEFVFPHPLQHAACQVTHQVCALGRDEGSPNFLMQNFCGPLLPTARLNKDVTQPILKNNQLLQDII